MNRANFLKLLSTIPFWGYSLKINQLKNIIQDFPNSAKMPVLFLGHGSPMNAIEDNEFVRGFKQIAQTIPQPSAILCISAHWLTKGTKVTAMSMPKTIHDFRGFPKELFEVNYPAKGSPELAKITQDILQPIQVELNHDWGLDHGAWSVIKHLYPNANIPVVQLSVDYNQSAQYHFDLGKQLNKLRNKGVLIIGSGNIVHNLQLVDFANFHKDNYGFDWAKEAREFVNDKIINQDFQSLINYSKHSKALQLAIPTPDHFFPLIYTLALKEFTEDILIFNDKLLAGSLSMTSLKIG